MVNIMKGDRIGTLKCEILQMQVSWKIALESMILQADDCKVFQIIKRQAYRI